MTRKVFSIFLALVVALSVGLVACDPDWEQEEEEEEEIDMDDAIDIVMSEILPEISWVSEGNPYLLLKLASPLAKDTVIEEGSGNESAWSIELDEETYFFYLDLAPGAFYEHDVIYIFVGKRGNPFRCGREWWPRINGNIPEELRMFPPYEVDVVDTNVELAEPTVAFPSYSFPPLFSALCEGFIVVEGIKDVEPGDHQGSLTYLNGMRFFDAYRNDCSQLVGLEESQAGHVLDIIDHMVDDDLNPITIFMIAHGYYDSVWLGDSRFTANQFRDKLGEHSDTIFNLILGQCHSGSFVDDLETLDNVCVVTTACDADGTAWGDLDKEKYISGADYNPDDIGSEWTSSLLEAMARIVRDYGVLAQQSALHYRVPETCLVIGEASTGCLGYSDCLFDLTQDLDYSHRYRFTHPCLYRSYDPP